MGLHLKDNSHESTGDGPLAIVDGDIIARACASAADGRAYEVDGFDFKYKKNAITYCKNNNIDISSIEETYNPDPLQWALHSVDEMLFSIFNSIGTHNYKVFLSGKGNFRYSIYPEYKANRKDSSIRIPEHLNSCRKYLIDKWNAAVSEGCEADDLMATESRKNDSIICTIDKDLDTIEGTHFNWNTNKEYYVTKTEAMRNFYKQMITGDTADNIMGLSEKKPKRRTYKTKPIDEMEDIEDMEWYVYCGYVNKYGEEKALSEMELNGMILHINDFEEGLWQISI